VQVLRKAALVTMIAVAALSMTFDRSPTYAEDIAPLVNERCADCHRPSGFAPFSLLSYEDVAKRTELIRRVTINRQMPPTDGWSSYGEVAIHSKLNDAELRMLQDWIRTGTPEGPKAMVPPAPRFDEDWRLGPPDYVVRLERPTAVRLTGNPYWRAYFVSLPDELVKRGLVAFDVKPVSPKAVRHVLMAQDPNAASTLMGFGFSTVGTLNVPGKNLIGGWAPGYRPFRLPQGSRLLLEASPLLVQIHYAPTGKFESGQIEIALYFAKGDEARIATWTTLGKDDFTILPEQSLILEDSVTLNEDVEIVAVHPEARLFADQVNLITRSPNEIDRNLLQIYAWKLDWVGAYNFAQPPKLPKGTKLIARIAYDNGRHAPANEEREKPGLVTSGPTLMDEIFKVHVLSVRAQ
jgi:hypothetical protein